MANTAQFAPQLERVFVDDAACRADLENFATRVVLDFVPSRARQRPGHQDGFGATQAEYLEAIYEKLTAGQRHRAWP